MNSKAGRSSQQISLWTGREGCFPDGSATKYCLDSGVGHNFGQTMSWTEAWLSEKSCREARAAKERKAVCFWAVSLCQ